MLGKRKRSSRSVPSKRRKLSKPLRAEIVKVFNQKVAKSITHNGPVPGPIVSGAVANLPTVITDLSSTTQGTNEYNRRGDAIYIDRIRLKFLMSTTVSWEALRLTIVRQPRGSMPAPIPVQPANLWQNFVAGQPSIVSSFQDDQPYTVMKDKTFLLGIGAGMQEARLVTWDLKFKKPLPVKYFDNTINGNATNTVVGDIQLIACSTTGAVNLSYGYDLWFHEK